MLAFLEEYLKAQGWSSWRILQRGTSDGLVWFIFRPEQRFPSVVAKISQSAEASTRLREEAAALEKLAPFAEELRIPQVLLRASLPGGGFLLAQSGSPGHRLSDNVSLCDGASLAARLTLVEPWIEAFQGRVPPRGTAGDWLSQAIPICKEALRNVSAEEEELLAGAASGVASLEGAPGVAVHGDFWAYNLLDDRGRISVVDWTDFHYGGPTEDLHGFLASAVYRRREDPVESAAALWQAFFGRCSAAALGRRATLRCLQRWNLGTQQLRPLFVFFLISQLTMVYRANHAAWRALARRYVAAGMPEPFGAS